MLKFWYMSTKKSASKSSPRSVGSKNSTKTSKTVSEAAKNNKTVRTTKSANRDGSVVAKHPQQERFSLSRLFCGFTLVAACGILIGCFLALIIIETTRYEQSSRKVPDSVLIAEKYPGLGSDNLYTYKTATEIKQILEHGTGLVFLGFPSCPWCQAYAPMLDKLAKEYGLKEIYYYDIAEDRASNTEFYQSLVSLLGNYLQYDNVGTKRIYVPNATFVVNGEIIANDWETSKDTLGLATPEEYWTEERLSAWQTKLRPHFERLRDAAGCASSCNQ